MASGKAGKSGDVDSKDEKCGTCKKMVTDDTNGLQCELCNTWYHTKCQGVQDSLYQALNEYSTEIFWFCKQCKQGAEKFFELYVQIQTKLSSVESTFSKEVQKLKIGNDAVLNRVVNLEKEVVNLKQINEKYIKLLNDTKQEIDNSLKKANESKENMLQDIKQEINNLRIEVEDKTVNVLDESQIPDSKLVEVAKEVEDKFLKVGLEMESVQKSLQSTKSYVEEERDKEARRNNIMVYRMPESIENTLERRIQSDRQFLVAMMNSLNNGVVEEDIGKVYRLGKRTEGIDRPLLVQFKNHLAKNLTMDSLFRLKETESRFKNVIIGHDMTKNEREQCKQLVEEAKFKTAHESSGEVIYKVRGPPGHMKIISVRRRH